MPLTVRQRKFCERYSASGNASQSYREAFNYHGSNADVLGSRQLVKVGIQERINEIRRETEAQTAFTRDEAIRIMGDIVLNGQRDSDRIAAANVIGRWNGWDAPQRVVVSENPLLAYLIALRSEPLLKPAAGETLALEGKGGQRW